MNDFPGAHAAPPGRRPRWLTNPPGGRAVWLSGAALFVALVALVVSVANCAGPDEPVGASATVGPTIPVGPASEQPASPTEEPAPGGSAPPPATTAPPAPPAPAVPPAGGSVRCPQATVTVADTDSLKQALAQAKPGDSIQLRDGTYTDKFVARTAGTEQRPIFLCGGPGAVLDGGSVSGGYVLHLDGASHWRVVGFSVRNGQKGVMADGVTRTVIQGLTVEQIGDEAIHLRKFSSDNVVQGNTVRNTGLRRDDFGEGIYVGTAQSNWGNITGGQPDNSDRNVVRDNHISATTAEPVDIKEGTTGGVLSGNTFDGGGLTGSHADSWVDVKGNRWLIEDNTGRNSRGDGFQTHQVVDGWGSDNLFKGNTAEVNGPGYGFAFTPTAGNRASCDNKVTGAAKGFANVSCS
jgi:Right handed beta helix region